MSQNQFVLLPKANVRLHTHLQIFKETERTIYKHYYCCFVQKHLGITCSLLRMKHNQVHLENSEFIFLCQTCYTGSHFNSTQIILSPLQSTLNAEKEGKLQIFPGRFPCSRAVYILMIQYSITTVFHQDVSPFFPWSIQTYRNNLSQ